ncbi:UpxY family transcription antiterminator [Formosa haliotis]|uniref:UpxY family transcription antiterminator n=1 Tax=Formosa haliotis TaxID=1555194 RepID=UPI0008267238|nr:UpxY family transcription antiterminator [Formosa haliotis]
MVEAKWYVVYTKARNEKKVEEKLTRLGIEAYCPVKTEIRIWSDRRKKVKTPLLPSMVLVKLVNSERNRVFDVAGVVRYMFWDGQPVEVKEREVLVLKEVEKDEKLSLNEIASLQPGAKIEMTDFGFEDQLGEIKQVSGNQCWVILKNLGFVVKLQMQ